MDLGTETSIQKISLGCLQSYKDWIFMPQNVKFETSNDGINFSVASTAKNNISVDQKNTTIKDFTVNFPQQKARFVRVTTKNLGVCPIGHPGAGKPAWLFADEIVVN